MSNEGKVSAELVTFFGDAEYLFKLPIKQIDELQRICDAGIGDINARVTAGRPYIRDIYDTIRLGLIGGGMPPVGAFKLVEQYVNGQPLANVVDPACPLLIARAVLNATFFGLGELVEDEPNEGKAGAAVETVG